MDKKKESLGSRLAGSEAFLSVAASLALELGDDVCRDMGFTHELSV